MYNNPYFYQAVAKPSLLSRLLGRTAGGTFAAQRAASGINWGTILSNTQKSLGIINQAIPIVYQVKPIISNAKTMFKLASAVKSDSNDEVNYTTSVSEKENSTKSDYENKPIFYI